MMPSTWDEILSQILTAGKLGRPYQIPFEEFEAAVPEELSTKGISNSIYELNRIIAAHGLRAELNMLGRFVVVRPLKE